MTETNKRMRSDQETLDLAKEYGKVLQKITGLRHANYQAAKAALKKALGK